MSTEELQKTLIYVLERKVPNKEEFHNIEEEDWEEYYNRINFIELNNVDEVLNDLIERTFKLYRYLYFILKENKIYLKLKLGSFDSQIELDSLPEIITEIANDEIAVVDYGRDLADYYIQDSKFKGKTSEYRINVYREKGQDFKLNVTRRYEDYFNIIDIDNFKTIYEIEYRINHYLGYKIFIELKEQDNIEIKNIRDSFKSSGSIRSNSQAVLEELLDGKYITQM